MGSRSRQGGRALAAVRRPASSAPGSASRGTGAGCVLAAALGVLLLAGGCGRGETRVLDKLPAPVFMAPPVEPQPTTAPDAEPDWLDHANPPRDWQWIVIHHSATPGGSAHNFDVFHRETRGWDELGYHFVIGNGTNTGDGAVEVGSRWVKQKYGAHAATPSHRFNDFGIGVCLVGDFEPPAFPSPAGDHQPADEPPGEIGSEHPGPRTGGLAGPGSEPAGPPARPPPRNPSAPDSPRPTPAQWAAAVRLCTFLCREYRIAPDHIIGHRDAQAAEGEVSTTCPGRNLDLAALRRDVAERLAAQAQRR